MRGFILKLYLKTNEGRAELDGALGTIMVDGQGGSVRGVVATVETAGDIDRRITATRLVLAGPFALAWRKKKDERELYLLVEGESFSLVARIDQTKGTEARQFAAAVNTASKQASSGASIVITSTVPDLVGKIVHDAIVEIAPLKLGTPKFVDAQGRQAPVMSFKKWRITGQSGIANSLVFEVEKVR